MKIFHCPLWETFSIRDKVTQPKFHFKPSPVSEILMLHIHFLLQAAGFVHRKKFAFIFGFNSVQLQYSSITFFFEQLQIGYM
jgi:hypothetical protein